MTIEELEQAVNEAWNMGWIAIDDVRELIERLHEQPIVRCKDCKYYCSTGGFCTYDGLLNRNYKHTYGWGCYDDWYCADGERKKGR